jgi:histidinol-phosphate/aromatic aminotransferase/cobyric acid decarboxylase-like protein
LLCVAGARPCNRIRQQPDEPVHRIERRLLRARGVLAGNLRQTLRAERASLLAALADVPGATAFPSEANMILVRVPDAKRAFEGLKERGVLVKNVSAMHPLLAECLRLTVGAPDENRQMIDALKAVLR